MQETASERKTETARHWPVQKMFRLVGDFEGETFRDCLLAFVKENRLGGRASRESDGSIILRVAGSVEAIGKMETLRQKLAEFNLLSMTELLMEEEAEPSQEFTFL